MAAGARRLNHRMWPQPSKFLKAVDKLDFIVAIDLVTTEWNEHVKRGKDMASAAIFLAMVINAGIWVYTFFLS